jgi:hypothetical protein
MEQQVDYRNIPFSPEYIKLRLELYNSLEAMPILRSRYLPKRIKGSTSYSRVINFGTSERQGVAKCEFKANKRYPLVYKKLIEYGKLLLPSDFTYTIITINKDTVYNKHIDSDNVGKSYQVCIGDYTAGGVYVYDKENNKTLYDTHNTILSFNGSENYSETQPFTGTRFNIIFYQNGSRYRFGKSPSTSDDEEIEEMVQTSLAHGLIDEHLEILQWKKDEVERSLVECKSEDTEDRLERILEQRKKMLRVVSFD